MLGELSTQQVLVALLASFAAGAANAIAGGGTAIAYPALVWLGLPPISANATNAVALWPGNLAATWSYRKRLADMDRAWLFLIPVTVAGGAAGAWLLLRLPPTWFASLAPFMVMGASLLIAAEPVLRRMAGRSAGPRTARPRSISAILAIAGTSLYGGYFGAGIGVLLLVALDWLGAGKVHDANAWKNVFSVTIKAAAVAYLVTTGRVVWVAALTMALGAATGGAIAGWSIQRAADRLTRWIVVLVGVAMGIALLLTG